jgi:hypothetical protein
VVSERRRGKPGSGRRRAASARRARRYPHHSGRPAISSEPFDLNGQQAPHVGLVVENLDETVRFLALLRDIPDFHAVVVR